MATRPSLWNDGYGRQSKPMGRSMIRRYCAPRFQSEARLMNCPESIFRRIDAAIPYDCHIGPDSICQSPDHRPEYRA